MADRDGGSNDFEGPISPPSQENNKIGIIRPILTLKRPVFQWRREKVMWS
jgi:hypothetical protein